MMEVLIGGVITTVIVAFLWTIADNPFSPHAILFRRNNRWNRRRRSHGRK
jgi:hypothetical protein